MLFPAKIFTFPAKLSIEDCNKKVVLNNNEKEKLIFRKESQWASILKGKTFGKKTQIKSNKKKNNPKGKKITNEGDY